MKRKLGNTTLEQNYKELYTNKWLSLRETDGHYIYSHSTRSQGSLVAILIIDAVNRPGEILGRIEKCPSHFDGFALCSFTGGTEDGNPLVTAQHEIYEEAGFRAHLNEIGYLGTCRPSKSSDTVCHLFVYDTKGATPEAITGDGSLGEVGASTEWVDEDDSYRGKDPLNAILLGRYKLSLTSTL